MIRFFKINDPFRAIAILFILLALRLPNMIGGYSYLNPEMNWMLLGEKINEGLTIYVDIDTKTGVLSAIVYWLIDLIASRSTITYQIFALIVVFIQAILINTSLNRLDVLREKTYLPALFYALLSSVYIDFFTLSPALMASTFLILGMNKIFHNLKFGQNDEGIFMIGFYIGIASLFYFPSIWYGALAFFALLFYTSTPIRRYVILIFACFFPYLLVATYFYWIGGLKPFLVDTLFYSLSLEKFYYLHWNTLLLIFTIPILVLILGVSQVLSSSGFINFQQRCNRIMVVWLIISSFMVMFAYELSGFTFVMFIPAAAYFISSHFILIRRKIPRLVIFSLFIGSIFFTATSNIFPGIERKNWFDNADLEVTSDSNAPEGRILVLGKDRSYFQHADNSMAGRYLEWKISKKYFNELSDMRTIAFLYDNFKEDLPEAIVDDNGLIEQLFFRIPHLQEMYYRVEETNLYRLKSYKKGVILNDHS